MAKIISDKILYSSQFAEYYTGNYFFRCSTFNEVKQCLASERIFISKGFDFKLTEMQTAFKKMPEDAPCVIVQFSTEEDYTEYEYRLMRIQKKYIKKFMERMYEAYEMEE